jgi:hypothetical protein
MSHPVDYIPDLDSPHQSRSPLKKDKKERVSYLIICVPIEILLFTNSIYFHRKNRKLAVQVLFP